MKRFIGSISRRGSQESDTAIPNGDSPEASVARGVRLFCESGGPNNSGEEVLHLPLIVEAAESSPAAAKEAANRIRKFLSKENFRRAYVQYNAIMLIRILADNPGKSFTKNLDAKFVMTVKELLRHGTDMSVQQILRETLDAFETQKADDETLYPLRVMWNMEKSKPKKQGAPPIPRPMNAPPYHPNQPQQGYVQEQNYFARSHRPSGIPPPIELAQRIEEARTSAKLLLQVVQSTPPNEIIGNQLLKEFVDRCQSALRSVQSYIHSNNPPPDQDTLLTLIETNDQLASAISRHQRALLQATRHFSPTSTPPIEPSNGQRLEMPASTPNGSSSRSGYTSPSAPLPALPSRGQALEDEQQNPFDDQHTTDTARAPQPHDYGMPPSLGQENIDPSRTDAHRQSYQAMPSFAHGQAASVNNAAMYGGSEAGPATTEEVRKPIQYRF